MTSVIVEADGGSRGNPGPAAYGALLRDEESGAVLAEAAESIGVATNNVAEYRGLIAGLHLAQEVGATVVEVRMDSKLVIEQMAGRWRVKHPDMKPLALQAMRLAGSDVAWTWVPRSENAAADALLNGVLDGGPPVWRVQQEPGGPPAPAGADMPGKNGERAERGAHGERGKAAETAADRAAPTVLVLLVRASRAPGGDRNGDGGHAGDETRLAPVVDAAGARAARDEVLREHPGETVRRAADARTVAVLVSHLLVSDEHLADRLEPAVGTEAELAWYADGAGALRRLGASPSGA